MSKKYIVFNPSSNHNWIEVAERLLSFGFYPKLWICDFRLEQSAKSRFPDAFIFNEQVITENALIGRRDQEIIQPNCTEIQHDSFSIEEIYALQHQTIAMLSRLEGYLDLRYADKVAIFWHLFQRFDSLLSKFEISGFICSEFPHTAPAFVLMSILRMQGKPIVFGQRTRISSTLKFQNLKNREWIERIHSPTDQQKNIWVNQIRRFSGLNTSNAERRFDHLQVEKKVSSSLPRHPIRNFFPAEFLRSVRSVFLTQKKLVRASINRERPWGGETTDKVQRIGSSFSGIWGLLKVSWRYTKFLCDSRVKLPSRYKQFVSCGKLPKQYVYFTLHLEPEMTTNPEGGVFWDQQVFFHQLRKLVPVDVNIVVKEHYRQAKYHKAGLLGRGHGYYSNFMWDARTIFVDTDMPSSTLIEGSVGVATVNGTVALEALVLEKKVILGTSLNFDFLEGISKISELQNWTEFNDLKIPERNFVIHQMYEHLVSFGFSGQVTEREKEVFPEREVLPFEVNEIAEVIAKEIRS